MNVEWRQGSYRLRSSNCRPLISMRYSILLFRLSKCNTSLESYRNQLVASIEFETMEQTYAELSEISFTEAVVRCAVVMALVHNNGEVDNRTIANTIGVDMRTIQRTRKKLEEGKDSCGVITGAPKSLDDRQKSRNADFVKRTETMIDNEPSKSMKSIAAELGMTVVLPWMKHVAAGQCSLPFLQPLPRMVRGALLQPRNQAPST
ncbi:hypothetical protein FHG87_014756 [Trinorchestia longiramus]|nr:hypothetical protein FHG87_014756 [Trinorchestia longiramus]